MIDAQAVLAQLEELEALLADQRGADRGAIAAWLQQQLSQLPLSHQADAAGNNWYTLPGASERTIVLGTYAPGGAGPQTLDSALGLVIGLQTLKALPSRFSGPLPCSVQLVLWAATGSAQGAGIPQLSQAAEAQHAVAYLEAHIEAGSQLQQAGAPLGVAAANSPQASASIHPHLTALGDEAIRELTGTSASLPSELTPHATAFASAGVATAVLYVQPPQHAADVSERETRLHFLQAAESFGRWTEAAVHSVAGDQVDLWAREHRVPHNG